MDPSQDKLGKQAPKRYTILDFNKAIVDKVEAALVHLPSVWWEITELK